MPATLEGYRNYSVGELYSVREMSWPSAGAPRAEEGP
jgi:hypothetical protein